MVKKTEKVETEVVVIDKRQQIEVPVEVKGNSPAEMIREAIKGGANLDNIEKLLSIQKEWEANEARKIFASSFASAQANIGAVLKTKLNPQTHSKYADLNDIIESSKPIYTKEGFAIIFYEGVTTVVESIRVCADVLHSSGHKETYFYDVPLDGVGIKGNANMTKIHGKSSSVSYGRRYLMCMIWNIPTQDDDGNLAGKPVELVDDKQLGVIRDNLAELNIKEDGLVKYLKIEKLEDLTKSDYPKALTAIEARAKTIKEKADKEKEAKKAGK